MPLFIRDDGDVGDDRHDDDGVGLGVDVGLDVGVEARAERGDRVHAQAERRAHAEGGARDGDGVDAVADGREDEVAEERVERAAHRRGHVPAVADDAEGDGDDDVGRPGVETPVVEGLHHRELRAVVVVVQRPAAAGCARPSHRGNRTRVGGDAVRVHADGDAAGEEHGEPRDVVELGLLVCLAQLDGAVLREGHVQKEHDPDVLFFLDGFFVKKKGGSSVVSFALS